MRRPSVRPSALYQFQVFDQVICGHTNLKLRPDIHCEDAKIGFLPRCRGTLNIEI